MCVVRVRDLCKGPITNPEEFYRVCVCVSLRVLRWNNNFYTLKTSDLKNNVFAGFDVFFAFFCSVATVNVISL